MLWMSSRSSEVLAPSSSLRVGDDVVLRPSPHDSFTTQKVRGFHLQTKHTDAFDITFHSDDAIEAINAPQAILSKGHKEYRTRTSRGQKQGNADEWRSWSTVRAGVLAP